MLSLNAGLQLDVVVDDGAPDTGTFFAAADTPLETATSHEFDSPVFPQGWTGGYYEASPLQDDPASISSLLDGTENPLTVILDFNDPGQADTSDDLGNTVSTFNVESYGFALEDFDLVTEAILEEVRSDYLDIVTSDILAASPIPSGQELAIEFEIGNAGELPVNGSNDYYYVQIGTGVSGDCIGALGCASLNSIRDASGSPSAAVGSVVGSIFTDAIQGIGFLSPANALSIGSLEFTTNAIAGTTSHEVGHAVSLLHLNKAGAVTPHGLPPIMGTGAIDLPNQDRIGEREFALSGVNQERGNQEQFSIDQLVGALGLHEAGTGSRGEIVVDTILDENDGDLSEGHLSLREAIEQAVSSGRRRKIIFDPSLAGQTMILDPNLSSLEIGGPVVIEGPGSEQLTIQATDPTAEQANGDGFGVFVIDDGNSEAFSNVQISGVRLTGADSSTEGGAIASEENLTLKDVVIDGNASTGKGGGIYSMGPLDITDSTFNSNASGGDGGGIYTRGGVSLKNSTVSGNSSEGDGGGIAATGEGTAIVIQSSTISGNAAVGNGGGMEVTDLNPTKLRVWNSTVTQNTAGGTGGGIYEYNGVLVLDHAIVAGNNDHGTAPDIDNVNLFAAPAVLANYSLVGKDTGAAVTPIEGNIIGTAFNPIDPLLGPLADNGGPTKTHRLLAGSPAINAGDPNIPDPPEFDQRGVGFDRISLGIIDMGAFESSGFSTTYTVDSLLDGDDGDFSHGEFTLREALALSNSEPGSGLINFDPGLSGGMIALNAALGELTITDTVTIDADDLPGGFTVDASSSDPTPNDNHGDGIRLLRIDDGDPTVSVDVELKGITLRGGDTSGDGGAIESWENLTLRNVSILENSAVGRGGGLFHRDGSLWIDSSTVANNWADGEGGGLWSNTTLDGPQTGRITNSTISTNTAGVGGGIYNFDGTLLLEQTTITNNGTSGAEASGTGGVFTVSDASTQVLVFSTIIAGNSGLDVVESPRTLGQTSYESLGFNLIGIGNAILSFDNHDFTEVSDPGLSTLANHGGKTWTHVPLPGSPAIDASDPSLTTPGDDLPQFDQRGEPYSRLSDGDRNGEKVLDIGAVEVPTPAPDADFDQDQDVDGIDFLAWQRGFGLTEEAALEDGDANGDGAVDGEDLVVWVDTYGEMSPIPDIPGVEVAWGGTLSRVDVFHSSSGDEPVQEVALDLRGLAESSVTRATSPSPHFVGEGRIQMTWSRGDRRESPLHQAFIGSAQQPIHDDLHLAFRWFARDDSGTWQTDAASSIQALDEAFERLTVEKFSWRMAGGRREGPFSGLSG